MVTLTVTVIIVIHSSTMIIITITVIIIVIIATATLYNKDTPVRRPRTDLPLFQLLRELHLLLDGLHELRVDLHDVDAGPCQLDLARVLAGHGVVPHVPRLEEGRAWLRRCVVWFFFTQVSPFHSHFFG